METKNLKLPLLKPNDTGKEFIINQALEKIDNSIIGNSIELFDSEKEYSKNNVIFLFKNEILKIYYSLTDNNIGNNPATDTTNWKEFNSSSGGGYIGQITHGLRTDTPEGQLRLDGNEYPATVYLSFINQYLLTGKIPYKSLADYEVEMTMTGGNCGVFGYGDNKEGIKILRVPSVKDGVYIMQVLTGGLGSFTSAGLPNATGTIDGNLNDGNTTGIISVKTGRKGTAGGVTFLQGNSSGSNHLEIDLSVNSGIYGNSDTVQTNALSYPLFICVSNKSEPATEAQYNEFLNGLNNKINIDGLNAKLNNLSAEAIHNIFVSGTPDWTNPIQKSWNTEYIADEDGYISVFGNQTTEVLINGTVHTVIAGAGNISIERTYRIVKGDLYKAYGSGGVPWIRFYKLRTII